MNKLNHNEIIQKLCELGYPAYLVGGAVRDIFLDKEAHDFDVATKATPEEIAKIFGVKPEKIGKNFGKMLVDGIEVVTFRKDSYPDGNGKKNAKVEYAETIQEDLARRDLTMNSVAQCPYTGDIIDPHGGVHDAMKRILRFTGDADERINEDPDRILRACRLLAKTEGVFARDTFEALCRNVNKINDIDNDRIKDEILKAMEYDHPSIFFNALYLIGGLDLVFPGFSKCVNHEHGDYHLENVWEHCMIAGDSISPKFPLVRLAGYFHDCGKPGTYDKVSTSFHNHEMFGANMVDGWLRSARFSNDERKTVVNLVRTHMIGGMFNMTPKAIRKFRKTLHDLRVDKADWMRIRIADRKSNLFKEPFGFGEIRQRYSVFWFEEEIPFDTKSLALAGGELIVIFNLTPGPIVGKLQKHLLGFVIENGQEFNTRDSLFQEATKFLNFN